MARVAIIHDVWNGTLDLYAGDGRVVAVTDAVVSSRGSQKRPRQGADGGAVGGDVTTVLFGSSRNFKNARACAPPRDGVLRFPPLPAFRIVLYALSMSAGGK